MRTKVFLTIMILTTALLATAMPAEAAYETWLVGYWKFNETSGTSAADATAGHNGSLQGSTSFTSDTTRGRVLNYTGGNGYVSVPVPDSPIPNSDFDLGTGNFTISMWVYVNLTSYTAWGEGLMGRLKSDNGDGWGLLIKGPSCGGNGQLDMFASDGTNYLTASTGTVPLMSWAHVAAVKNTGVVYYYINGSSSGSATWSGSADNDRDVAIGDMYESGTTEWHFNGMLDDAAIWNTAKSAQDIYDFYVNGIHPTDLASQKTELNGFLTAKGVSLTEAELGLLATAAFSGTSGTATVIKDGLTHYEPGLLGDGSTGNPYYYHFSTSTFPDLDALDWTWHSGAFSAYTSLDNWYETVPYGTFLTASGDATIDPDELWIMKTGGLLEGNEQNEPVPEPATVVGIIILGAVGKWRMRKNRGSRGQGQGSRKNI